MLWDRSYDKIHQLSVLVLIHDRNNFFSGGVVICTDNFVKGCSAMKVVEDKTIDLIKLRRNHTNSCLMTGWLRTVLIYYITKCFFCKYFQEFISNWLIFFRKEKQRRDTASTLFFGDISSFLF